MFKSLFKKLLTYGLVFAVIFTLIGLGKTFFVYAYVGKGYKPFKLNSQGAEFKVDLKIPKQAEVGGKVSVIALLGGSGGFLSNVGFPHRFNWIVDGKTVQPLVAGSQDKLNRNLKLENQYGILEGTGWSSFKIKDGRIRSGGPPQGMHRTVKDKNGDGKVHENAEGAEDRDEDNMADEWEIKYFAGRTIAGKTYSEANVIGPNGYPKVLEEVSPRDDPDGDGFNWDWETIDSDNVPGGGDYDDDPSEAKEEGISSALGNSTGDGNLNNFEEYTFGLDPTSADTDQDGILDGPDMAGVGNNDLAFMLDPSFAYPGRKIPVEVVSNGLICIKGETNCPGDFEDGRWGLVWGKGNVVVTAGPPLQVTLRSDPEVPVPESGTPGGYPPVKVTAQVVGAEEEVSLYYKWYIGGTFMEDDSGYGKNEFEFSVTASHCGQIPIICDVSEKGTGRTGFADLKLGVGKNIGEEDLSASLLYNTSQDQNNDSCIDGDTNCNFRLDGDETWTTVDPFYGQINSDLQANGRDVRQNDVVKIETKFSSTNGLCPDSYPKSNGPEDFVYQWYLDGEEQVDQSGETREDFILTVTKSPGDEHLVKLKLIRMSDGFEYGQLGEKVFSVQTPTASIEAGIDFGCDEQETGLCRVILEPGKTRTVNFKTILENFQPTYTDTFHYKWTFDGEVPRDPVTKEVVGVACGGEINNEEGYCKSTVAESTLTYEFVHPGGLTEKQVKTHTVAITVDNYIDSDGNVDESAADSYTIEVVLKTAVGEARGPATHFFAQAGGAISGYFKNIFNIVLSIGIIGFIVFVVMAAGQFRKRE